MKAYCRHCGETAVHSHWHDAAHGIKGTHMAGSERWRCEKCLLEIYANDPESWRYPFQFDQPIELQK